MPVEINSEILSPDKIKEALDTKIIGREFCCFWETDSTQKVAQELAVGGADEGTVILAESQISGRGRMERTWFSPPGQGLWISIILRPPFSPVQAGKVSLTTAVSVTEAIKETTGLPVLIKWPNDILIHGHKVGGILMDMTAEMDEVEFIILGIGINVNQEKFPDWLEGKACSLKQEKGEKVSRLSLLQEILKKLERYYLLSFEEVGFVDVANRWRRFSTTLGKHLRVSYRREVLEGQAVDIDANGALLLRLDSGFIKHLTGGEVKVLGENKQTFCNYG